MKILLVEDEKRMAQALCQILRLENYEVDHCADGLSGLEAIETDIKELLARIRALGRRTIHSSDGTLTFGDIKLDAGLATLICTTNEQRVRLSEKEYKILEYMISNQGQILTREQLAVKIWGFESEAEYNNVEVYMSFTRKKLAFVGAKTVIKAVRGIGYELRCEDV